MHLALDVYYGPTWARGACVGFEHGTDDQPAFVLVEDFAGAPGEYEPGLFKKRELPYLEALVAAARGRVSDIAAILVDAYVWLEAGRAGLGGALWDTLGRTVPIIGVAKTRYLGAPAIAIVRGASHSALYITAAGIDPTAAAELVRTMHGPHRIPTMLRHADRASRSAPPAVTT